MGAQPAGQPGARPGTKESPAELAERFHPDLVATMVPAGEGIAEGWGRYMAAASGAVRTRAETGR